MIAFTFNTLDRFGTFGKFYLLVSNFINKNILNKKAFDPEFISDVFNAVDGFWIKYNKSKWYSESELRVIVGMLASSIRDSDLSPKEVQAITNYVVANWNKTEAEKKEVNSSVEELLPKKAEKLALKSAKIYNEVSGQKKIKPEKFVSKSAKRIEQGLDTAELVSDLLKQLKA